MADSGSERRRAQEEADGTGLDERKGSTHNQAVYSQVLQWYNQVQFKTTEYELCSKLILSGSLLHIDFEQHHPQLYISFTRTVIRYIDSFIETLARLLMLVCNLLEEDRKSVV